MKKLQVTVWVSTMLVFNWLHVASVNAREDVPATVTNAVPQAEIVGSQRFTYYFWDVYTATLFAPEGKWTPNKPFALKLDYVRNLKGKKIAQRSIDEMRQQGVSDEEKLNEWMSQMDDIFPDVDEGDTLTGVATESRHSAFYFNGRLVGTIEDEDFTRHFFNIWLGEKTSEPEFRHALLNGNN